MPDVPRWPQMHNNNSAANAMCGHFGTMGMKDRYRYDSKEFKPKRHTKSQE